MPDKKLTDNEIKRALDIQIKHPECGSCGGFDDELLETAKSALNLINRQEYKCKAYKHYYDECLKDLKNANAENETLKAEVERLKKLLEQCEDNGEYWESKYKTAKAEAYKEFAERLKDESEHFELEKENFVSEENIDNLLNELVGDKNGKDL